MPSSDKPLPSGSPRLSISVKALCAFGAKEGDLDFRFVPAPTAQEGRAGHSLVQGRRGPGYVRELSLSAEVGNLQIRGRADGYDPDRQRVEEIKTHRGTLERIAANRKALHWAQAKTYAAMLCARDNLSGMNVALVYLDLGTGEESVLESYFPHAELWSGFELLCGRFKVWADQEGAHRIERAAHLEALQFPHHDFRPGQRDLSRAVFRAAASQRCLMAQAPTGIGKTVATLFPLLRGWPKHGIDKVFFLTAKNAGKSVALRALELLERDRPTLRVLELTSRANACERPGAACHGEACDLAKGFYDRLGPARQKATQVRWLDRRQLRSVALAHDICPYYLAQEMARWADVVVADFNAWFDGSAMLFALTREEEWRTALLVDEAHNLVERGRAMYSASVDPLRLQQGIAAAPAAVRPALVALERAWRRLRDEQAAPYFAGDAIPPPLQRALQDAIAVLSEHVAESDGRGRPRAQPQAHVERPGETGDVLQQCLFELLAVGRLLEGFGPHSVFESVRSEAGGKESFGVRNLVPAAWLRGRFAAAHTAICFSGTITPFRFYRDMLGLPADTVELAIASPFHASQLQVHVARDVSTRFHHRGRSLTRIVDRIAAQCATRPGNYMAFFSSFAYLEQAHALFVRRFPHLTQWKQTSAMSPMEQEAFVERFCAGQSGIGFAVLGGAFSEGVDLPGERLCGAFIATLGLPQHDAPNEITRARMDELFGEGYNYTYLYPGLRKVVQAAGRVIRTETDSGVLHLLDDRFAQPDIQCLLPEWWSIEHAPWQPDEATGAVISDSV